MTWESMFQAANLLALAGWIILILAPRGRAWLQALPGCVIPAILSAAYFVLAAVHFGRADGGYGSLDAVAALFASEPVLLAGWLHYLAFDLFIGAWIARRSDTLGVSRVTQAPILLATFLLGPVGLLMFLALQSLAGFRPAGLAGGSA